MRYALIPFALRKIKSDIASIIKEIEEAVPVADSFENQGPTRSSRAVYSSLFGLKEDQKRVRQVILSGTGSNIPESSSQIGVPVIPICGAVGSGKTTLAKRILYEDPIVTKEFNTRIWVNVSEKFEIRDILRQVLVSCHGWMKHMFYSSEEQLLERIEERLKSQRTLIVLDDIRSIEAWETVCKTFPKLDKRSIVLVTTRVGYVAEYICRNEFVHTMTPLNEEALFREALPPRADTVYNELPDHLKPCFVYLGHFLEDQEIDPEKLSHLWMIEGLLSTGESARGESTMEMTERYLRELTLKGIVKVQAEEVPTTKKFKACCIVQGIENFCVSNCEQKRFLKIIDLREKDYSLSSIDEPRRLVIYLGNHRVDIEPKVAKIIRSLRVVLGNMQQIENEFIWPNEMLNLEEFRVLRILDFNGIDFRGQKLPTGIFNLELLRYLSFKGCVLEELPSSISKLSYMQVLDLRVKELIEIKIPNVLGNMRRLNHLYLPLKFVTQNGKKLGLNSLTELATLENFNTRLCKADDIFKLLKLRYLGAKVEGDFDDLVSITNYMKTTLSNFLHSTVDVIDFDCYAEERHSVLRELFQCQAARILRFKGHIGRLPSSDEISPSFTQLVLNKSHLNESSMPTLEKLPNLGVLVLSDDAYIAKKIIFSDSGFPKLKRLELLNLCFLEIFEVKNTAMPILCSLEIRNCEKLESLPDCLDIRASNHFLSIIWPEKGRQ
ncbi:disease resistance RPP8-like protein 3 [Nicotiana tomentosiformis]